MKALVYHGPGERSWDTVPDPVIIEPTDAVVRIDTTTICGTDLHILKGDVPACKPGTILGHEAVGTVIEVGSAVTEVAPGDHVLVSCVTSCARCRFCKEGRYGQCTGGGGWIFGHTIDGLQAELARVPFADTSLYKVPEGLSDEDVLFLADILPTAFEVGVLNGRVQPGDVVAVVGAGPIGLATIMTAKLFTPAHIVAKLVEAVQDPRTHRYSRTTTELVAENKHEPSKDRKQLQSGWPTTSRAWTLRRGISAPISRTTSRLCISPARPSAFTASRRQLSPTVNLGAFGVC